MPNKKRASRTWNPLTQSEAFSNDFTNILTERMANMEDKQFICDMLLNALRATDSYRDVVGITYVKSKHSDESHVVIHFLSGTRIICTTMDSGCTIYNFIDKYYELYGEKLSERTVRRKFKNADLVQKRLEGQKKVYGSGTDN